MKSKPFLTSLFNAAIWASAAAFLFFNAGRLDLTGRWRILLIAAAIVLVGEVLEIDLKGGRRTQVSPAIVFALFVLLSGVEVVAVVSAAFALGILIKAPGLGWGPLYRSTTRRLGSAFLALWVFMLLNEAIPAVPQAFGPSGHVSAVIAMIAAGVFRLVIDTAAAAAFIANVQKAPFVPILASQLRARAALHGAMLSMAALMALAHDVLGAATFALFLLPLAAARYAFKRYATMHKAYVQTVRALAKVPELAGYGIEGHVLRVADLVGAIARERGLSDEQIQELEFAALLHDIGMITLSDPEDVPESVSGTRDGLRAAEASALIVGRTRYLGSVAQTVLDAARRYDSISLDGPISVAAKVLRVANDFVELTEEGGPRLSPESALKHLDAGAGTIYDPNVISALKVALARRRTPVAA